MVGDDTVRHAPAADTGAGAGENPAPASFAKRVTPTSKTAVDPAYDDGFTVLVFDDEPASPVVANSSGNSSGKPFPALVEVVANGSGKTASTSGNSVVANLPLLSELDEFNTENDEEVTEVTQGWRLEKNTNGHYRWRWQIKSADGNPITYKTKSGRTAYKRGSKYVQRKIAEKITNESG